MPCRSYDARILRCLALVTVFLLLELPFADAGETVKTDPARTAALAHFEMAKRLFDVREYGKALEEYKAAYIAKPDPAFLFNIGQCHRKLGQNEQALDFFQQFLRKAPANDPNRPQVEARIADIRLEEQAKAALVPKAKPEPTPLPNDVAPTPSSPPAYPSPFSDATAPSPAPFTPFPAPTAPSPAAGTDLSVAAQANPVAEAKPIYGTWWFWTGVGAAVVAGAATTAYLLSSKGGTNIPSTPLGNRPVFP